MSIIINEQKMVDDNTFLYEKKIQSPTTRFIDTTPVFVTYYHINDLHSTTDDGFRDINSIVGSRSPLRFNKIENFPLYDVNQIVLQLQDGDSGLDSSFEDEGIILPKTIKPLQNDLFVIQTLKEPYIFRVTDIQYDNIMPDNFYKISYKLEYLDPEISNNLENQVLTEYSCILENIGTEANCIIEKTKLNKINKIQTMYHNMIDYYMTIFYNKRHNVFLYMDETGNLLYDPFQTEFINKHNLFKEKNRLDVTILTDEFTDKDRKIKYKKSVYNFIEIRDSRLVNNFKYTTRPGITIHESSFYRWHEKKVQVLDIPKHLPESADVVFSDDFVDKIKYNYPVDNSYSLLIQAFIRKVDLSVDDIPLNLDEELLVLNDSIEVFFFTPIIMYIIREVVKNDTKTNGYLK